MKEFGFPREQKLKQKKDIDLLFQKGKWSTCGNLRAINLKLNSDDKIEGPVSKIGVSVSKKFFKRAVDRNRIKRLLREAYRHHKSEFESYFGHESFTMLFWVSKKIPEKYQCVETELINFIKSNVK